MVESCTGAHPPRGPQVRLSIGLAGAHLFKDRIRVPLSDNNGQAFLLPLLSVFKIKEIEMRPPNQTFSKGIYSTGVSMLGFGSLWKMFFYVFIFR